MNKSSLIDSVRERSRVYAVFGRLFDYPRGNSAQDPDAARLQVEYQQNFDCAANEGACSLHGADYSRQDRNACYEELLRFYNYYGLHRAETSELPDHLHVQLQFMFFLTQYEVECLSRGDPVDDLRRAQAAFLRRFLQPLSLALSKHLTGKATEYSEWSTQLSRFIADDAQELNAREARGRTSVTI